MRACRFRLPLSLYWTSGSCKQRQRCLHLAARHASSKDQRVAPPKFGNPRRVVVTGIGLVTPVGVGKDEAWQGLMDGKSGVVQLQDEGFAPLPSRVAGKVPVGTNPGEYNAADWLEPSEVRRLPAGIQFGLCAAKQAMSDAGWSEEAQETGTSPFDPLRTGVAIGTGISGAEDLLSGHDALNDRGYVLFVVPAVLCFVFCVLSITPLFQPFPHGGRRRSIQSAVNSTASLSFP